MRGTPIGRAIEHSIEDPFTGEITVRFTLGPVEPPREPTKTTVQVAPDAVDRLLDLVEKTLREEG